MRPRNDPRLTTERAGQIEFRIGADHQPAHGTARHQQPEFQPYRWRNPTRSRVWTRLPADLIALMKAEGVTPLPDPSRRPDPS